MDDIARVSELLTAAMKSRIPCDPVLPIVKPLGLTGAYRVQSEIEAWTVSEGAKIIGRKIGLTARAVQAQMGVAQPNYGFLIDRMECGDGEEIDFSRLIQPKVEAEIASSWNGTWMTKISSSGVS